MPPPAEAEVPPMRVVLPGDTVALAPSAGALRLGPGLRQRAQHTAPSTTSSSSTAAPFFLSQTGQNGGGQQAGEEVVQLEAYRCGVLRQRDKPLSFWVDSSHKHALAVQDELVIGVVTACPGETYSVDIGSNMLARLNSLSFEGATKRNKPRLQIGDLVYARLTLCNKDMEPELSCITTSGKANGMGKLEGGFMVECSLGLSRKLLSRQSEILAHVGKVQAFEVAIGHNGRLWVRAPQPSDTIIVANALLASEFMDNRQVKRMAKRLAQK